jgi:hypothetical protein
MTFDMRVVVPKGFDLKAPDRRLPVLFKVGIVTRHTSRITRHASHVTRHARQVYGGPGSILVTAAFRLTFDEWIASKGFAVVTMDGRLMCTHAAAADDDDDAAAAAAGAHAVVQGHRWQGIRLEPFDLQVLQKCRIIAFTH